MLRRISLIAALFVLGLGPAAATLQEDYLTTFRAYTKALNEEDQEKATELARRAYEQAVASGKASPEEKALLAHNYLDLVIWTDPQAALPRGAGCHGAGPGGSRP